MAIHDGWLVKRAVRQLPDRSGKLMKLKSESTPAKNSGELVFWGENTLCFEWRAVSLGLKGL
jgi:hypothetical protein